MPWSEDFDNWIFPAWLRSFPFHLVSFFWVCSRIVDQKSTLTYLMDRRSPKYVEGRLVDWQSKILMTFVCISMPVLKKKILLFWKLILCPEVIAWESNKSFQCLASTTEDSPKKKASSMNCWITKWGRIKAGLIPLMLLWQNFAYSYLGPLLSKWKVRGRGVPLLYTFVWGEKITRSVINHDKVTNSFHTFFNYSDELIIESQMLKNFV